MQIDGVSIQNIARPSGFASGRSFLSWFQVQKRPTPAKQTRLKSNSAELSKFCHPDRWPLNMNDLELI